MRRGAGWKKGAAAQLRSGLYSEAGGTWAGDSGFRAREERWGVQGGRGPGRVRGSGRVFVPGLGAVSTDKQYFGSGTRLTVLGKRGHAARGFLCGARGP